MGVSASMEQMQKTMKDNQGLMMERNRRLMISMQMAMTRERTYWFGGAASLLGLGLLVGKMRGKNVSVGLVPLAALSTLTAYNYDMGFGTKINRINRMHHDIISDERYWFNHDSRYDLKWEERTP